MSFRAIYPIAVLSVVLFPAFASARGGGGGHGFSSSHGYAGSQNFAASVNFSGGSSYTGSVNHYGGNTNGSFVDVFLFIILIILIIVALKWYIQSSSFSNQSISEPQSLFRSEGTSNLAASVAALQNVDPGFDPERFLQRAEMVYMVLKRAEFANREQDGQALLTPASFESWRKPLQDRRERNLELYANGFNIRRIDFVRVLQGPEFDECVVHLDIVMGQYVYDRTQDRIVWGSPQETGSGLRITFIRKTGVQTISGSGVTAKKCPSCHAPLNLANDGTCGYCRVAVSSGQCDWTISRLEEVPYLGSAPTSEKLVRQVSAIEGFTTLREHDTAFDPAVFVERTQRSFEAVQEAWQARNPSLAQAYMSEAVFLSWRTQIEHFIALRRINILEHLRLRQVTPVAFIHGTSYDTIVVQIDAEAADFEIDERDGKIVFGSKQVLPFTEFWSFQRTIGTVTGTHSIADQQCPRCGAPLNINEIGECAYCSAAVTSGNFDWVLSRIIQKDE